MKLILLTHPDYLGLTSQALFARMLLEAYRERGHEVVLRKPRPRLQNWFASGRMAKWAGYVDQYLCFPLELRRMARQDAADTLYVFCDQAVGPWVPALAHRPHVVHCHDLIALRSALGRIPAVQVSWTGRLLQRWIRRGFRHARHFISISNHTRDELHRYGHAQPETSEVVHNGLNHRYVRQPHAQAAATFAAAGLAAPGPGYLLHVGAGQWYKNQEGVVALYDVLARRRIARGRPVPELWLVSPPPDARLRVLVERLPQGARARFVSGVSQQLLQALYSSAMAMLFPSHEEGFGWPIAEAMACGCPVITTGEAPMNEVGGPHAHYLPRLTTAADLDGWAEAGAACLEGLLDRPPHEREAAAQAAMGWATRYDPERAINAYLAIYDAVLRRAPPAPVAMVTR